MQQAAILQQRHKQKLPKAPEEGREAQGLGEFAKFANFSNSFRGLVKAKCLQINFSKYFGTSQKVCLAILKAQNNVYICFISACIYR